MTLSKTHNCHSYLSNAIVTLKFGHGQFQVSNIVVTLKGEASQLCKTGTSKRFETKSFMGFPN